MVTIILYRSLGNLLMLLKRRKRRKGNPASLRTLTPRWPLTPSAGSPLGRGPTTARAGGRAWPQLHEGHRGPVLPVHISWASWTLATSHRLATRVRSGAGRGRGTASWGLATRGRVYTQGVTSWASLVGTGSRHDFDIRTGSGCGYCMSVTI